MSWEVACQSSPPEIHWANLLSRTWSMASLASLLHRELCVLSQGHGVSSSAVISVVWWKSGRIHSSTLCYLWSSSLWSWMDLDTWSFWSSLTLRLVPAGTTHLVPGHQIWCPHSGQYEIWCPRAPNRPPRAPNLEIGKISVKLVAKVDGNPAVSAWKVSLVIAAEP